MIFKSPVALIATQKSLKTQEELAWESVDC